MDVELIIDGVQVTAPAGASVLDVTRRAGRDVPALCYHEAVPAIASCRLCLVEIRRPGKDRMHLTTSCDYPASAGLVVATDSERIHKHRRMNLQLLLRRAPHAAVLQNLAAELGVTGPLFAPVTDAALPDCILCELCVRVCSVLGYDALAAIGRGDTKRVGPAFGQKEALDCVGCGSCREACPTDCIPMVDTATSRAIWGRTFDLVACERCGTPLMTTAQRAVTVARGGLPKDEYAQCHACKRAALSEKLASGMRG